MQPSILFVLRSKWNSNKTNEAIHPGAPESIVAESIPPGTPASKDESIPTVEAARTEERTTRPGAKCSQNVFDRVHP